MSMDFSACVKKAQQGDADAFAELYSLVYKDLYKIAFLNLNNNEHDASDVVSDTVLEAYSQISELKNVKAFKAWITRILTVKIKNKQKEYINMREFTDTIDSEDVQIEMSTAKDFDYSKSELMEGLDTLDEEERLVLSLDAVSGYKSEEIAKICGSNANTVRSKSARAREKLRQFLKK